MIFTIKNKKQIRWGIIGCGNVTEVKSGPAYQKTEGFEIKAVMRRDAEKVKDYAKRHHIDKYYTNAEQLINDNEIDAVYIATPPDSHMYYALKVAEAGKPCCIEKPLAPSYKDSLTIYEVFKKTELPLFVAYYRRSLPRFDQVKTWLQEERIGKVRHISWLYNRTPNDLDKSGSYNWRTDKNIAPAGYFDDLASHGIDLFIHLLGNVTEAVGISLNQQNLYSSKDAITASWLHKDGITGSGSWNFGASYFQDRVEIFGSKGKIEFSVFANNDLVLTVGNQQENLFIENPENIQIHHVKAIKQQLLDEHFIHPSIGQTAIHTSWVMDKILGNI